jgi:predicted ATP-grasp superfamily ATP-dependent carboligase
MTLASALTVMVHEWVTGGGLAGSPLPAPWAAQGRAMRRAIAADFACITEILVSVVVTLDAALPDDPGPWTIVRIGAGEHEHRMRELAESVDFIVLIAPETRGVLARLTADLTQAGARMLGSSPEAVSLAGDKARLGARLQALGIDTPPIQVVVPGCALPEPVRYPAVLKPIDGAGSADTYYLHGPGRVPEAARRLPSALLQPFVPGLPMSASFFVDREGRVWLIGIGAQRIAICDGRFEYQGGRIPAPCPGAQPQVQGAVNAVVGLRGFVGVDFIWDPSARHATILEINPRPTTSVVGLCRLLPPGHLARAWLAACGASGSDSELLAGLSELVHGQESLMFDSNGIVITKRGGATP